MKICFEKFGKEELVNFDLDRMINLDIVMKLNLDNQIDFNFGYSYQCYKIKINDYQRATMTIEIALI